MQNAKYLRTNYIDARNKAFDNGTLDRIHQNTGVYTTEMLSALRDMAKADVYPDGNFGDDECNVWLMFHLAYNA